MHNLLKATAAAVLLISGAAVAANAESFGPAAGGPGPSVATLPPTADLGPRTNSHNAIPGEGQAVAPSPKYVGPAPGASDAKASERFAPPAGYATDRSMQPYSGGTVRPN